MTIRQPQNMMLLHGDHSSCAVYAVIDISPAGICIHSDSFFPWYSMNKLSIFLYQESQISIYHYNSCEIFFPIIFSVTGLSSIKRILHLFESFITVKNSMNFMSIECFLKCYKCFSNLCAHFSCKSFLNTFKCYKCYILVSNILYPFTLLCY